MSCILLCRKVVSPQVVYHHACLVKLGMYKKSPQTLGSCVVHGRSICEDLAKSTRGLTDGPVFADCILHFGG